MKRLFFLCVLSMFILIMSCRSDKKEVRGSLRSLSVDLMQYSPSALYDSCRIVPLETSRACLLYSPLYDFKVFDKYLFIIDGSEQLHLFTIDGKFIQTIAKGKGPGELVSPMNFTFDKNRKELLVIDLGNVLKSFSLEEDGLLKPVARPLRLSTVYTSVSMFNDMLLLYKGTFSSSNTHFIHIWNDYDQLKLSSKELEKPDMKYLLLNKELYSSTPKVFDAFMEISQDTLMYSQWESDTIYLFTSSSMQPSPFLVLDHKMNRSNTIKKYDGYKENVFKKLSKDRLITTFKPAVFDQDVLVGSLIWDGELYFMKWDVRKGEGCYAKRFHKEIIPNYSLFSWNNKPGALIDISSLKRGIEGLEESRITAQINALPDDGNPVLVFFE